MKIVQNLDINAVTAEAMELTQVGFIDCLRKVNQDKYLTLKAVREHFEQKVSKVISAKDCQIKC